MASRAHITEPRPSGSGLIFVVLSLEPVPVVPVFLVIAESPVVPHSAQIVVKSSAAARVERIVAEHFLDSSDGFIQLMPFVTALLETGLKIEQIAPRLVEAFTILAGSVRIAAGPVQIGADPVEQSTVLARVITIAIRAIVGLSVLCVGGCGQQQNGWNKTSNMITCLAPEGRGRLAGVARFNPVLIQ